MPTNSLRPMSLPSSQPTDQPASPDRQPLFGWALVVRAPALRRAGVVIVSALLAHTAWHWMVERGRNLRYVDWPALDSLSGASLIGAAVLAGSA